MGCQGSKQSISEKKDNYKQKQDYSIEIMQCSKKQAQSKQSFLYESKTQNSIYKSTLLETPEKQNSFNFNNNRKCYTEENSPSNQERNEILSREECNRLKICRFGSNQKRKYGSSPSFQQTEQLYYSQKLNQIKKDKQFQQKLRLRQQGNLSENVYYEYEEQSIQDIQSLDLAYKKI